MVQAEFIWRLVRWTYILTLTLKFLLTIAIRIFDAAWWAISRICLFDKGFRIEFYRHFVLAVKLNATI